MCCALQKPVDAMAHVEPADEQNNFLDKLVSRQPVIVHRRILWGDCDPAGVVYTPRFGDYFTSARDWFMRAGIDVQVCFDHGKRAAIAIPEQIVASLTSYQKTQAG